MDREERERVFEQNVAAIWREQRVSCPHPDILRAFLEGGLAEEAAGYLRFHLEEVRCPWCTVALQEMKAEGGLPQVPAGELAAATERTLRSTIIHLRSRR